MPSVKPPAPRLRACVPVNENDPFTTNALLLPRVSATPDELSSVMPAPKVRVPEPGAVELPRFNAPALMVSPPAPELLPLSVSIPVPVLMTLLLKITSPEIVSDEPLAPVPITSQVCAAPVAICAEMVTTPALSATEMPLLELTGVSVSVPPLPGEIEKAVTPAGAAIKRRLSTARLPSSIVSITLPVVNGALAALNTSVSEKEGSAPTSPTPFSSMAQFVLPPLLVDHDPS